MKKIVVFVNSMEAAGGKERVVANLVNNWAREYQITLLVKDYGKSFYKLESGVEIQTLNVPLVLDMNNRKQRVISLFKNLVNSRNKLKQHLSLNKYDYIYVTTPYNALEIYLAGRKYLKKLVVSEHASIYSYNKFYQYIKKIVYPKAYRISVPTTMDTGLYRKKGYKAEYIPHLSTFGAVSKNKLNSKRVINIGRLTADKQQLLLLQIWSNLSKKNMLNDWKLTIVGKGEEENNLLDFIKMNKLKQSVEIVPPQANVEEIYRSASLFAFTSRNEGFGMVLLEAMSFGIPCISFDCPSGPRDIIKNNINGKLIKDFNIKEYENQLSFLLNERIEYLEELGNKAFYTVQNWNNNEIISLWKNIFREG